MERFEIFTICRRPPVLQTDASVGMMKRVVRETEARNIWPVDDCSLMERSSNAHAPGFHLGPYIIFTVYQ